MPRGRQAPPPPGGGIDPAERAIQQRFVVERWDALTALAWEEYQRTGRGAVVLRVVSTAGQGTSEALYVSEQAVAAEGIQWPDPDTTRMVAAYVPEREIVIAVERALTRARA